MSALLGLRERATDLTELMDDPDCDRALLIATYERFAGVNRLVSGWRGIYRSRIRPLLDTERTTRILDIGFGGGDVPVAVAAWAHADGLPVDLTAIDPDERSLAFATDRYRHAPVTFRRAHSSELVAAGERYDLVLSNHLLHHLDTSTFDTLLDDSAVLARRLALHNDLERSPVAYAAYFAATRPGRRRSFLHVDGLRSIRRSYRAAELRAIVPSGWQVERRLPMRLLLSRTADAGTGARRA